MAEFNFKSKRHEVRLAVKREAIDGSIEQKDLVFDCSPTNYRFIKRAAEAGKAIQAALGGGLTADRVDDIVKAERDAFETVAPGQWEEFFAFLDEDVENIAHLIKMMLETVRARGIEAKADSVSPAVPDGESV